MREHRRHQHTQLQHQTTSMLTYKALSLLLLLLISGDVLSTQGYGEEELLDRSLSSLDRMVHFFGQDFASVNVDGVFGIRVGQGDLNQTLKDCANPRVHCPRELVNRLIGLNSRIEDIASHAMPYIQAEDEAYFDRFHQVLDGPFIVHYQKEFLRGDVDARGNRKYDEEKGDMCFSLLLGSYENEPRCTVTEDCWNFMTEGNHLGYVLTHQLLYFMVADKTGCVPSIDARLRAKGQSSVRAMETKLCGEIFSEAKREENNGRVNILRQDLFLEQSLLCSLIGYQNFISHEWVRMVLSWQNGHGCFSMVASLNAVETQITKLRGEERRLLQLMKQEAKNIDNAPPVTGRKLLREKMMKGDCLAHKTGLAFGLVGAYIRYFVRQLYAPPDFNN